MEPSRCKTTSTVTLSCELRPWQQATSKVLGSTIFQTQYMISRRQNPNIQPYKIIPTQVCFSTVHNVRRSSLCADRKFLQSFLLLLLFLFAKLKQLFCKWSSKNNHNPCGEGLHFSQQAGLSLGLEVRRVFYWVFTFTGFFFWVGAQVEDGGGGCWVGGPTNVQGVRGNNSEVYKIILVHVRTQKGSQIQILMFLAFQKQL